MKLLRQLAVVIVLFLPMTVNADVIVLNFETPATGSELEISPLVTAAGIITVANGDNSNGLLLSRSNIFAVINFFFNVDAIEFEYSGAGAGVFTANVYDEFGNLMDTFFDPDTTGLKKGLLSFLGPGIRRLSFADEPGGEDVANIDNLTIFYTPTTVPEPGTLALLSLGLLALGISRRKKQLV